MPLKLKKNYALIFSFALFAGIFIVGFIYFSVSKSMSTYSMENSIPGAKLSLNYLGDVRSYPNKDIPKAGFSEAFQQAKISKAKSKVTTIWEAMGPTNIGGRTLALAINPDNPNVIFAGSASGGLWKSTTGGVGLNAWKRVSTGFPVLGVAAISIDPQNSDVIYIGTGESYGTEVNMPGIGPVRTTRGSYGIGILKSLDGGITWEKSLDWSLDQRRAVQKIQVNPFRSESIWAASTEGTYRTRDGGDTWVLVHDVKMATDVIIDPSDTTVVFTANGGMGSLGHGVYRTKNSGDSFEKMDLVSGGGPSNFLGKAVLDISKSDPSIIMASIGNGDGSSGATGSDLRTWLMRSENSGDTWSSVFANNAFYGSFQGWYSHAIAINPSNPQEVWAVGQPQIYYRSTTGGQNLDPVHPGRAIPGDINYQADVYPNLIDWADHHDIVFHPTDPKTIYFINDGGIFRTTDGGLTMENCNSGYQTVQFYNGVSNSDTDKDLILGGLQDNNSIIYEGSLNWRRAWVGDGSWTALNQENNNISFLSSQHGYVAYSNDLFTNSRRGDLLIYPGFDVFPTSESNFITPLIISPANNKTLYLGGERILKSTDDGKSWTVTNGGNPLDGNAMSAMVASHQDVDVVYATSSPKATRPNVFRTNDGGITWQNITGNLPDRYPTDLAIDPLDDLNIYITFGGFGSSHVFKSKNGGNSWLDISANLPDVPTWAITIDPENPNHIFVGNEVGVFQSLNSGESWENINGNIPDAIFAIELVISRSNRKLRLASHGNGVFETDLPEPDPQDDVTPSNFTLSQNYPNPFNPSTTIEFELAQQADVSLKVFNTSGRLVATLVDEPRGRGSYTVNFDASGLASGAYIYKLQVGNNSSSKKMVLIK